MPVSIGGIGLKINLVKVHSRGEHLASHQQQHNQRPQRLQPYRGIAPANRIGVMKNRIDRLPHHRRGQRINPECRFVQVRNARGYRFAHLAGIVTHASSAVAICPQQSAPGPHHRPEENGQTRDNHRQLSARRRPDRRDRRPRIHVAPDDQRHRNFRRRPGRSESLPGTFPASQPSPETAPSGRSSSQPELHIHDDGENCAKSSLETSSACTVGPPLITSKLHWIIVGVRCTITGHQRKSRNWKTWPELAACRLRWWRNRRAAERRCGDECQRNQESRHMHIVPDQTSSRLFSEYGCFRYLWISSCAPCVSSRVLCARVYSFTALSRWPVISKTLPR